MVFGFGVNKNDVALNPTQSGFGKWFYGEAQKLKELRNTKLECMSHVEASHLKTHDIYFEIYNIFFKKDANGLLNSILGPKGTPQQIEVAKKYYEDLESASKELMDNTLRFEKRILAIPPEEIEEIFSHGK